MPNGTSNHDSQTIWLEVANVRLNEKRTEIQVKGDRAEREPTWWNVSSQAHDDPSDALKLYRTICDGLDKKRIVIAGLGLPQNETSPPTISNTLECISIRIQYGESANR